MTSSTIAWTDHTVTPVIGCTKVSAGCKHCYAETLAYSFSRRFANGPHKRYLQVLDGKRWNGRPFLDREYMAKQIAMLTIPQRARNPDGSWRPARIFNTSMGDVFHEGLTEEEIGEVWRWMAQSCEGRGGTTRRGPTWIVLTKRPARAAEIIPRIASRWTPGPVVHLLTSIESQDVAAERLDPLMALRRGPGGDVALVGVSAEPLLGPVDFRPWLDRIGWIIVGAESGKDPRPMRASWVADIVDQCRAASVPVFVKQLGRRPIVDAAPSHELAEIARTAAAPSWPGPEGWMGINPPLVVSPEHEVVAWLRDPKGGDPSEWPEALRVREWPAA